MGTNLYKDSGEYGEYRCAAGLLMMVGTSAFELLNHPIEFVVRSQSALYTTTARKVLEIAAVCKAAMRHSRSRRAAGIDPTGLDQVTDAVLEITATIQVAAFS